MRETSFTQKFFPEARLQLNSPRHIKSLEIVVCDTAVIWKSTSVYENANNRHSRYLNDSKNFKEIYTVDSWNKILHNEILADSKNLSFLEL